MKIFKNMSVVCGMMTVCAGLVFNVTAGEKLTIAGSSTVKPIAEAASKAFKATHPDVMVIIGGGGSSSGVKNAGQGTVDIGMASRKVKDKEMNQFPSLVPIPIGLDGVAIIVNKKNPVNSITRSQLQQIYTGEMTSWKALGGNDASIDLVGILLKHGTAEVFMKFAGLEGVEEGEGAGKVIRYKKDGATASGSVTAKGADGNKPACAAVLTKPNAISFASIGFAQSLAEKGAGIKLLELDGVKPEIVNVKNGSYPLVRPLQVITNGEATGLAAEFIDFLMGSKGQKIVADKGYIPAK
ncbi:MAG: phosphate ABC transporter substrate-binding protein [Thermodesulfobacteriota bacterium]|nr:phosphate ABC transporter substrate-binding protein [Thermodesulfobacteriota bacterium]